ncbi:MAG: hypothetical protein BAJALOKI2v1_40098 [Promethearchaeota archaeon]|nr:MAG: hypothetical protein BAJALOKI2v1_40098 [Candidatus Lokiarchaeota archaeon]
MNHFCNLVFMQAGRSLYSSIKKDSDLKDFARKQLPNCATSFLKSI